MSRLLELLHRYKDNRGMMANLRCVLVDNKKHRAWPVLNRLGVEINDNNSAYIAGLFATHPEEIETGNFGSTCKAIEQRRGDKRSDDGKLTPTERRFQYLLVAEKEGGEVQDRVLRMVLMAKSQGIPVNYTQLETDLRFWSDRIKTQWATAFWTQGPSNPEEEDV